MQIKAIQKPGRFTRSVCAVIALLYCIQLVPTMAVAKTINTAATQANSSAQEPSATPLAMESLNQTLPQALPETLKQPLEKQPIANLPVRELRQARCHSHTPAQGSVSVQHLNTPTEVSVASSQKENSPMHSCCGDNQFCTMLQCMGILAVADFNALLTAPVFLLPVAYHPLSVPISLQYSLYRPPSMA